MPALVAVAATGAALACWGLAIRVGEAAPPVGRDGTGWLVWLAAALTFELVTLATPLPTLSDLGDSVLAQPPVRAGATVAWLLAGGWLLTRPRCGDEW